MTAKGLRRTLRIIRRILLGLVLTVCGLAFYIATFGIPAAVTAELIRRLDSPESQYVAQIGALRWRPWLGIEAEDVKIFRKGSIAPSFFEADHLIARVDSWFGARDETLRGAIEVAGARLRPEPQAPISDPKPFMFSRPARFSLKLRDFTLPGLFIREAQGELVLDKARIRGTELRVDIEDETENGVVREGRFTVDSEARTVRIEGETRINPRMLLPLATQAGANELAKMIEEFSFDAAPPLCNVQLTIGRGEEQWVELAVEFFLKDFLFRETDLLRADGKLAVSFSETEQRVAIAPLFAVRKEGIATGEIVVDVLRHTVEFNAASTLEPLALVRMIGLPETNMPPNIRFEGGANIAAQGVIHYRDMERSMIEGSISGRNLQAHSVQFNTYALDYRMTGRTNALDNVRGRLYGGTLAGRGTLIVPPDPASSDALYTMALSIEDVDFDRFLAAINPESRQQNYEGIFSLHLDLAGETGTNILNRVRGQGKIRVKDGRMLMLPIFGGLTEMLARYIPGVDFLARQDFFRSEFKIAEGKIRSDKVTIEGNIVRIQGRGEFGFDQSLDFRVGLRLLRDRNILSYITEIPAMIFDLLFEFQLRGTVDKPEWLPFGRTLDFLSRLGLRKS